MSNTKKKTVKKATKKKVAKKAPKVEEKKSFMELLKRGWDLDMKILKSCWDFLKVGDACAFVVGGMSLWLLWGIISNIF
tara:strand:+ start:1250 stop:1486 length:237 start_codon:yes stop_codon:yes gene_type:complete